MICNIMIQAMIRGVKRAMKGFGFPNAVYFLVFLSFVPFCMAGRTEWEDALIKHGIIAAPEIKASDDEMQLEYINRMKDREANQLSSKTLDELDELEDEMDDGILESYRRQRMQEMAAVHSKEKYGELFHIGQTEFVHEVTNASNSSYVVVHLFQNHLPACKVINAILEQLAPRHKAVKFVKIVASEAIKNWPENQCPAVLVYDKTNILRTFVGIETLGGLSTSVDILEWILAENKIVSTELEEDPRNKLQRLKITRDAKTRKYHDTE